MYRYSLDSIAVDGFRGLRKFRLEDMGLINILVGPNNCGKTSALEAISIACDPFNPHEWLSMVVRRDFGRLDESRIQSFRWCFEQSSNMDESSAFVEGTCSMESGGRLAVRKLKVSYVDYIDSPTGEEISSIIKYRSRDFDQLVKKLKLDSPRRCAQIIHYIQQQENVPSLPPESDSEFQYSVPIKIWEGLETLQKPQRQREMIRTQTLTPYSYQLNSKQVTSRSRQIFSNDPHLVSDLVRRIDADVEDVQIASFEGKRAAIYLKHKRLGLAPLSVFGDAIRRSVLLASTLSGLRDGGILFIDELETGIHVTKFGAVFSWLVEAARHLNVQVIATTHSLEIVDAIALSAGNGIDDVVTYHIDQSDAKTRVRRIEGDLLLRIRRDRGLDIR